MANRRNKRGPNRSGTSGKRAATAGVVLRLISTVEQNCHLNQQALVDMAKRCHAFGEIEWSSHVWDVTHHYRHINRGADGSHFMGLYFTESNAKKGDRVSGTGMKQPFADIAKAIIRLRHFHKGQALERHGAFLKVLRHLYHVLKAKSYDITDVTPQDFDEVLKRIRATGSPATHYSHANILELIGRYLDSNGLAKVRLEWVSPLKYASPGHSLDRGLPDERIEDALTSGEKLDPYNKLPSEEVIRAIAKLYQQIPKGRPINDIANADRIRILIVIIMVCTGLRASEVLSLIAEPVQTANDGSKYIRYYVRKQSMGNTETKIEQKTLLTDTEGLVIEVIDELLELTAEQRKVAKHIFENGIPSVELPQDKDKLSSNDILAAIPAIGQAKYVPQWLKNHKVKTWTETQSGHKRGEQPAWVTYCRAEDIIPAILTDHWNTPVVPGNRNNQLELHEALCVVFHNQLGDRMTLPLAVQPVTKKQLATFLQGHDNHATHRRNSKGVLVPYQAPRQLSIFERYGLTGEDGERLKVSSHGFRHFINHLLDEGGAPDTIQSVWFGRKSDWQNAHYQHMTPAQRAAQLMEEVMQGKAEGYVPRVIEIIPVDRREAFLKARIHAIHDVGTGLCVHEFQLSPCEKHLQCEAGCNDYIWVRGDRARLEEVQRKAVLAWYNLERVRAEIAEGYIVEDGWLSHNQQKFDTLHAQLESMGVEIDYAELARTYLDEAEAGKEYIALAEQFARRIEAKVIEGGVPDAA